MPEQFWNPNDTLCYQRRMAPDAFLEIQAYNCRSVDQGIFLAVAADRHEFDWAKHVFELLAPMVNFVCHVYQRAPWGSALGEKGEGYTNSLEDFLSQGFPIHTETIAVGDLRGRWKNL